MRIPRLRIKFFLVSVCIYIYFLSLLFLHCVSFSFLFLLQYIKNVLTTQNQLTPQLSYLLIRIPSIRVKGAFRVPTSERTYLIAVTDINGLNSNLKYVPLSSLIQALFSSHELRSVRRHYKTIFYVWTMNFLAPSTCWRLRTFQD